MKNRIIFKIIATGLNFVMSIITGVLIPRAIGPSAYGDFSYITSTYAFLFQILMFSSTTAYIYFLSHRKYKIEDINMFYMIFLAIVSFLVIIVGLISTNSLFGIEYLWHGLDNQPLLYLGLIFSLFTMLQQRLIEFSDSTGQTIVSEKLKLLSRVIIVLLVITFIYAQKLDIYWYFILSLAHSILFFILFYKYIVFKISVINWNVFKDIFDDFYIYLKPLIIFSLIGAIYAYLGRYVLQDVSGSEEQGYYMVALNIAMIPVQFISTLMAIYMSSMVKSYRNKNKETLKYFYSNDLFKVYSIHLFIVLIFYFNSKEIIIFMLGYHYISSYSILEVLSIFSLLHTFGLLGGNIFFSTDRNKQYSLINGTVLVLGIIFFIYAYFSLKFDGIMFAIATTFFFALRLLVQTFFNLSFLNIKYIFFFKKLFLVSFIIWLPMYILSQNNFNMFIKILLYGIGLLLINHIYNDFIGFKKLLKGKNE